MSAKLTGIVRDIQGEVKSVLASQSTVVEKTVVLRRIARKVASDYFDAMHYQDVHAFFDEYDKGRTPLTELEGEGVRFDDLIILRQCPMVQLFDDFQENKRFPDYWGQIPQEFMNHFKNEAILHPLCIVHQSFRDELSKKIPKGKSFVHSVAVACRSGNGKVVYSDFGLHLSNKRKDDVGKIIDGMACAFHVR